LWGISDPIVEAVAFHHHPAEAAGRGFAALTAVHAADVLHHALRDGPGSAQLDAGYLQAVGCSQRVAGWCDLARTTVREEPPHA
jgi:hypothetical protein